MLVSIEVYVFCGKVLYNIKPITHKYLFSWYYAISTILFKPPHLASSNIYCCGYMWCKENGLYVYIQYKENYSNAPAFNSICHSPPGKLILCYFCQISFLVKKNPSGNWYPLGWHMSYSWNTIFPRRSFNEINRFSGRVIEQCVIPRKQYISP